RPGGDQRGGGAGRRLRDRPRTRAGLRGGWAARGRTEHFGRPWAREDIRSPASTPPDRAAGEPGWRPSAARGLVGDRALRGAVDLLGRQQHDRLDGHRTGGVHGKGRSGGGLVVREVHGYVDVGVAEREV